VNTADRDHKPRVIPLRVERSGGGVTGNDIMTGITVSLILIAPLLLCAGMPAAAPDRYVQ
jgi:hypothetical protein